MNSTSAYSRITENLQFLKSKESLDVLDQTLDYVNKNNLSFVDGFLYFTEAQLEKEKGQPYHTFGQDGRISQGKDPCRV